MAKTAQPVIVFQQSLADHPDAHFAKKVLKDYPNLGELRQTRRLSPGYSGARVYLATVTLRGTPPTHWVLKIGDEVDLGIENEAVDVGMASPASNSLVPRLRYFSEQGVGLLVYQFAGLDGQSPIDLAAGLASYSATELLKSTLDTISAWGSQPDWKSDHVTKKVQQWASPKLEQLPESVKSLSDRKAIYFPDLGVTLANPVYYIKRKNLPRLECPAPFSFTHGDLNLHNVLFPTNSKKEPDPSNPRLIDFRHAGTDQWSIVDLAKLEACIRHQFLATPANHAELSAVVAFLDTSSESLSLRRPPEIIAEKRVQEYWRHITTIRETAIRLLGENLESSAVCYWGTLLSYSLGYASYGNRSEFARRASFMDACQIYTRHFQSADLSGAQGTIPLQPGLSSEVHANVPELSWAAAGLLKKAVQAGNAALIVGSTLGRQQGVEPLPRFLQNVHRDLNKDAPPTDSLRILLASLHNQSSRQSIVNAINGRVKNLQPLQNFELIASCPWAAVGTLHYHSLVRSALKNPPHTLFVVESESELDSATADLAPATTIYFPFLGDSESRAANVPLALTEVQNRFQLLGRVTELLRRKLQPISLILWKCEEIDVELLLELHRSAAAGGSIDCYYLSDQENPERENQLKAIGINPVRARLEELINSTADSASPPIHRASGIEWRRGESVYQLPRVSEHTHGLLEYFTSLGAITATKSADDDFLLGAPVRIEDIQDGRVVRRSVVEDKVAPAIGDALASRRDRVRTVLLQGRPGAGVSTVLSLVAMQITTNELCPCLVLARSHGHESDTWRTAGQLIGEISNQVGRPASLIVDASDFDPREFNQLAEGVHERNGDVVIVLGGRPEVVAQACRAMQLDERFTIDIPDSLEAGEWRTLAKILRAEGFSAHLDEDNLAQRLADVNLLLPAIYEATDRQNRKFREIVIWEYSRHSSDQSVQRAYRLVCAFGVFGIRLTQYWLLKAVGGTSVQDASRILSALSDDIVVESGDPNDVIQGELLLAPRHRLIAEAVLDHSVPDTDHRLADVRSLIETANLASRKEGGAIKTLLTRKGLFVEWLISELGHDRGRREAIALLDSALEHSESLDIIRITLLHQSALLLRDVRQLDEAIRQAQSAYDMDTSNPASAHVLGLVHRARALDSWRGGEGTSPGESEMRARSHEQEALTFFDQVRKQQPHKEYGYEAEARYLRMKQEILASGRNHWPASKVILEEEARLGLSRSLRLLAEAKTRVRWNDLVESPKTRAIVLSQIGRFEEAWAEINNVLSRTADLVRRSKVLEVALGLAVSCSEWILAEQTASELIDGGSRSPFVFLAQDDALKHEGRNGDRLERLRESAEEWNREDIETQLRWTGLCLEANDWTAAKQALIRAQRSAQRLGLTIFEQNRKRDVLKDKGGQPKQLVGSIERLFRPYEGLVRMSADWAGAEDVYFRSDSNAEFEIGTEVTFELSWSIRGLRANLLSQRE